MAKKKGSSKSRVVRRTYDDELKSEAVQMLLDGHSAQSIVDNLGISGTNLLYRWKDRLVKQAGRRGFSAFRGETGALRPTLYPIEGSTGPT